MLSSASFSMTLQLHLTYGEVPWGHGREVLYALVPILG